MKISLNWLKDFVEIPANISAEKLGALFTVHTAEVEGIEHQGAAFNQIVVGQIQTITRHPNADKLKITRTSVGKETVQIVCGGTNLYEGMYVAVALPGAQIRWHGEGNLITLEPAKIRGEASYGMICAAEEIGLEKSTDDDHGVIDLSSMKPLSGTPLADLLQKNDTIFTIDNKSLTHRPDLWGHYGIAREISAILQTSLKPFRTEVKYPTGGLSPQITVKEKKLCPRYIGTIIENISVEPSPPWLKKRLAAIGYRSINNIVDATNYVMAELGQPLHAFDLKKIDRNIIVRLANENEEITTLDGTVRKLSSEMLVIADHSKAVAIAGVMGSTNSEVDSGTTSLLLEAANFHSSSVRKTSVRLGLRTEAVQRFEKSLDPNLAAQAMDRLVEIILKLCPQAIITGPKTDIINFKNPETIVSLNISKLNSQIGKKIPEEKVISILNRLGFETEKTTPGKIRVKVPSFRPLKDIEIEADIVEEVSRMYGYENIEAVLPTLLIKTPTENTDRKLEHRARQIMALGLGFNEVYNYSFYSENDIKKSLLPLELHEKIANYLSEDQTHLRTSLIPNLLKNVVLNAKNFDHFKIFEIGHIYHNLEEYFPHETRVLSAMIVGPQGKTEELFAQAKGALESLLNQLGIMKFGQNEFQKKPFYAHPAKTFTYRDYSHNKQDLGTVYELHPQVAKNFFLEKMTIVGFDLDFEQLVAIPKAEIKYRPLPRFPGIEIDISVLVDKTVLVGNISSEIQNVDSKLIKSVELIDLYTGTGISSDKKALTYKVLLRSDDRTLTDADMKQVQQKIFETLISIGGQIRGK